MKMNCGLSPTRACAGGGAGTVVPTVEGDLGVVVVLLVTLRAGVMWGAA